MPRNGKGKICKIHKKKLTPDRGEWFIIPIRGNGLECTDCVDDLDFWLPLPVLIAIIVGTIYYTIFPPFPGIRYSLLILGGGAMLLFFTLGSTWRVLKRLSKNATSKNS